MLSDKELALMVSDYEATGHYWMPVSERQAAFARGWEVQHNRIVRLQKHIEKLKKQLESTNAK